LYQDGVVDAKEWKDNRLKFFWKLWKIQTIVIILVLLTKFTN
jgi:hypothetical protein